MEFKKQLILKIKYFIKKCVKKVIFWCYAHAKKVAF